jgi:hypothetical protein
MTMKDPATELRAYLVGLNVTESTADVPIYDHVPPGESEPYIFISDITIAPGKGTKGEYLSRVAVTFQVVTKFQNKGGGKKRADAIASQLTEVICVRSFTYSLTNFRIFAGNLINSNYMEHLSGSERVVTKILTTEFQIEQI